MFPARWEPSSVFRRDFAWRALETWLPQGASTNDVLGALQQWDLGVRRQDFLRIAEAVRQSQTSEMKIRGQDRDQLISAAHYTEREWQINNTYIYRVNVFGTDPNTGEDIELKRLIGSDDRLSPSELDYISRRVFATGSYPEIENVMGAQPYGVIVRTGFFS